MILDLTRHCLRGTSKFSWDRTLRNVEFPAVAPELLARCAAHATRSHARTCTCRCLYQPLFLQHHSIGFKYDVIGYRFLEVPEQGLDVAGTHLPAYCCCEAAPFCLAAHRHYLLQVGQVAFDELLRKMPDVVVDFSSAAPVHFFAKALNFCDGFQGLYDGNMRMTPGQELVFTSKVRLQPIYVRTLLGEYKMSTWNAHVMAVRMRR